MSGSRAALLALFASCLAGAVACGGRPDAQASDGGEPAPGHRLGFHVSKRDAPRRFVAWESERTLNQTIIEEGEGATFTFEPGTYEIRFGIVVAGIDRITLRGGPGVRLVFPPDPGDRVPTLRRAVAVDERVIELDRGAGLIPGGAYQIYPENRRGDRLLEFTVESVEGDRVRLTQSVKYMSHVKAIPAGSVVLEAWNFVRVLNADDVTIEGFEIDGGGVGGVDGHTIYSGVLAQNHYRPNRMERPAVKGLAVRNNVLRNLQGRGIAVYSVSEVTLEDNVLEDIRREAIEIDHYASAVVRRNRLLRCDVGIALDDAFDTIVEDNVLEQCRSGVHFIRHFDDAWVNTGNVVRKNRVIGPGHTAFQLAERTRGNTVRDNEIVGMRVGVVAAGDNVVEGNVVRQ